MPPTNIHVLIGRNGVGKTRLLAGLAKAILGDTSDSQLSTSGSVIFPGERSADSRFANLVAVGFSAFDRFAPVNVGATSGDIRYSYVGLKKEGDTSDTGAPTEVIKSLSDLRKEFEESLVECAFGPRRQRWADTVGVLESDPGFQELSLPSLDISDDGQRAIAVDNFDQLSSGHKIVLLTATRLVTLVDDRTLTLIDEPETHLHPPLLSAFIRALSGLLHNRNGAGVVATHSPVVLQEVPRSCVSVLRKTGAILSLERPSIETFGENVGVLTREVFQLEVTESGFHNLLVAASEEGSYQRAVDLFGGHIGGEAKGILRALTAMLHE